MYLDHLASDKNSHLMLKEPNIDVVVNANLVNTKHIVHLFFLTLKVVYSTYRKHVLTNNRLCGFWNQIALLTPLTYAHHFTELERQNCMHYNNLEP